MNHSIYSADRTTHLKIVVVALAAAIAVCSVAISSRVGTGTETVAVVKAGQPMAVSRAELTVIR